MARLKTVGIKELKNNLSAYIREVRLGTRVLVSDRNRVVAELREPTPGYGAEQPLDPDLARLIDAGIVSMPATPKGKLPQSPVKLPEGLAERLLEEDRGQP